MALKSFVTPGKGVHYLLSSPSQKITKITCNPDSACLSSLYRADSNTYHLVVAPTGTPDASYSRICNVLAEFGDKLSGGRSTAAYHDEHYEKILERNALSAIAKLS